MAKKFGGRPQEREPEPGRRTHLSLAVTMDIKRKLEDAATARGCSVSTEASSRLESTFTKQQILPELLKLVYPEWWADFCVEAYNAGIFNLSEKSGAAIVRVTRQKMHDELKALPPLPKIARQRLGEELKAAKQRAKK